MLPLPRFTEAVREEGIDFLTGVPCSSLQSLVDHVTHGDDVPYLPAPGEGEAIAIAVGAWLAGLTPMVVIQNSGLGNCVNPLTSLALTYRVPLLIVASHRGLGGADAPQHRLMGGITYELLDLMGIPAYALTADLAASLAALRDACSWSRLHDTAAALVVPQGTFARGSAAAPQPGKRARPPLAAAPGDDGRLLRPRLEALEALAKGLSDRDLVVATTGMTSRELFHVHDRSATFYMMGSMGCAPALALGLTRGLPDRKVVVIDGEGALLMRLGMAATIGHCAPRGLVHVLLDNGAYETTGGQPTVSEGVCFEQLAHAVGYRRAVRAKTPEELGDLVSGFRVGDGPALFTLRIAVSRLEGVGRVGVPPVEMRDRFRRAALDAQGNPAQRMRGGRA